MNNYINCIDYAICNASKCEYYVTGGGGGAAGGADSTFFYVHVGSRDRTRSRTFGHHGNERWVKFCKLGQSAKVKFGSTQIRSATYVKWCKICKRYFCTGGIIK